MKKENKRVAEFFDNLTEKHGFSVSSLAYGSAETQRKKFQVLVEAGLDKEKGPVSVLDVGCGFGDLAEFIQNRGIECTYKGIDISSRIIAVANSQRPRLNIALGDILEMEGHDLFDYVLATGFNCVKTGHNWKVMVQAVAKMYDLSKKAVALGAVSTYRDNKTANTYYASPENLFRFCMKNITRHVVLRHDYMPHDFTIYLYK